MYFQRRLKNAHILSTCQMLRSYPNLNQLSALLCFNCKMILSKIENLFVKMHNVFLAQSDVRCSDLIPILTSCLRSFPAVKAFWRKLKARWQSYENQIGIGELLFYIKVRGFLFIGKLNLPHVHLCYILTFSSANTSIFALYVTTIVSIP